MLAPPSELLAPCMSTPSLLLKPAGLHLIPLSPGSECTGALAAENGIRLHQGLHCSGHDGILQPDNPADRDGDFCDRFKCVSGKLRLQY